MRKRKSYNKQLNYPPPCGWFYRILFAFIMIGIGLNNAFSQDFCPVLDKVTLCQGIQSEPPLFTVDPRNTKNVHSFCTAPKKSLRNYEGHFKGNIIECTYKMPSKWEKALGQRFRKFSLVSISHKTRPPDCPELTFTIFEQLLSGTPYTLHPAEEWRLAPKKSFAKKRGVVADRSLVDNRWIKSSSSMIYSLCSYDLEGVPVLIRIQHKSRADNPRE